MVDKRIALLGAGTAAVLAIGAQRAYAAREAREEATISDLEKRVQGLEAAMAQLGISPEVYGWVDKTEERLEALESGLSKVQTELSELDRRLDLDQQKIGVLEGTVSTMTMKISELDGRLSRTESGLTDVSNRLAGDESRISALETAVTELRRDVDRHEGQISTLDSRVDSLEARVSSLETKVSDIEKKLEEMEQALAYACYKAQLVDRILPPPFRVLPPGIVVALCKKYGYVPPTIKLEIKTEEE
jgi:chromosome segregation ATPase